MIGTMDAVARVAPAPVRCDAPPARGGLVDRGEPVFVTRHAPRVRPGAGAATHPFAAIAFHVEGSSSIEQGGTLALGAGDVLLVPPGQPHRWLASRGAEVLGLGLGAAWLGEADGLVAEPFERVRRGASAVVRIPPARQEVLRRFFHEIEDATSPRRHGEPAAVRKSLVTLVLHEVRRAATWDDEPPRGTGLVADALAFIEKNGLSRIGLAEVAQAVGKSPAHVTTAITKATGKSAVAWIIAFRMAEARRLLASSDEIVEVVSERVGYADPTHFIRLFRRENGATPAAWRAARRGETGSARTR